MVLGAFLPATHLPSPPPPPPQGEARVNRSESGFERNVLRHRHRDKVGAGVGGEGGSWARGKGMGGGRGSDYQDTTSSRGFIYTTTDRVRACVVSSERRSILLLVRTRYQVLYYFAVYLRTDVAWIFFFFNFNKTNASYI